MALRKTDTEVLVVGAGPVGMLVALLLHEQGVAVELVDEAWRSATRSYATALHQASLSILKDAGIGIDSLGPAQQLERIVFYDEKESRCELDVASGSGSLPYASILPQSSLESQLEAELNCRRIPIRWQQRLAEIERANDRLTASIEVLERASTGYAVAKTSLQVARTEQIGARFVVGADGIDSLVRRQANIRYESVGTPLEFDVFELEAQDVNAGTQHVVLGESTTDVLWTLPSGRQRWSFQVNGPGTPQRERIKSRLLLQVPGEASRRTGEEQLRQYVSQRAQWFDGKLGDIVWTGDVRFEPRLASAFGSGSIWLAGDAGHQTGPVGVQSMNAGLREARALADAIAAVLKRGSPRSVLDQYNDACRSEWRRLLGHGSGFHAAATANPWIVERAARVVTCLPASGNELKTLASQLGLVADDD